MNKEKPILVYSGNGVQGGAVVRQAVRQGYKVRALVRNPEKSGRLKELGVEIAAIDLQQGAQLRDAHRGIEYVVLQMPLGVPSQMEPLVSNAIQAIQANGVKGVVVKTGSGKPAVASDVPAFALNQLIEDKLREAQVPFAMVRPTMYLENFLRPDMREELSKNGTLAYSLPASRKVAWTCTDDIAKAALTLLENQAFGGDHSIAGMEAVDGEGLARAFSVGLSRDIRYQSLPLEGFEQRADSLNGAAMARRLAAATIRFIREHPDEATAFLSSPFRPSPELADFQPTSIAAWIKEHRSLFA